MQTKSRLNGGLWRWAPQSVRNLTSADPSHSGLWTESGWMLASLPADGDRAPQTNLTGFNNTCIERRVVLQSPHGCFDSIQRTSPSFQHRGPLTCSSLYSIDRRLGQLVRYGPSSTVHDHDCWRLWVPAGQRTWSVTESIAEAMLAQ